MTEAEWLAATDPTPMLAFLRGKASDRKLRLFAVACCHCISHFLTDVRSRKAVDTAERFADSGLFTEDWENIRRDAGAAFQAAMTPNCRVAHAPRTAMCAASRAALLSMLPDAAEAASTVSYQAANALRRTVGVNFITSFAEAIRVQCSLFRDIFNPFHPAAVDPSWRTSTAVALAQGIDTDRAFDRLPILAGALQDAGCDNPDLLNHCRAETVHIRGCWAIDKLLGKE